MAKPNTSDLGINITSSSLAYFISTIKAGQRKITTKDYTNNLSRLHIFKQLWMEWLRLGEVNVLIERRTDGYRYSYIKYMILAQNFKKNMALTAGSVLILVISAL